MRAIALFLSLVIVCKAAPPSKTVLDALRGLSEGYVAQTKHSLVDELQIVAGPIELSKKDAQSVAAFFSSEASYENGKMKTFCVPYYDFKFLLLDREGDHVAAIRLCTGCSEVVFEIDFGAKIGATLSQEGSRAFVKNLDIWFPGWREVSRKNRSERLVPEKPNKAPEPTPGLVTPRALECGFEIKRRTVNRDAARGAPSPVVAHL